ncbi:hypothetical protein HPB49_018906 [Dermacentor silvarum]|uniref:Uncharacterized protein n=1 Tax=Dermacentor silvarum TaxID=543639 RepID=A0ACB8DFG8_DERSI|nr:hypothetical protein HPB49_018906 [Dermacentor silvarum]
METCLMWREKSTDLQTAVMSLSSLSQIFHVINASVVNAWLEYRSDAAARGLMPGKQLDLLDFTLQITEALARADSRPKVQKRGRPSLSPQPNMRPRAPVDVYEKEEKRVSDVSQPSESSSLPRTRLAGGACVLIRAPFAASHSRARFPEKKPRR